jgi:hypothetical protein
MSKKNRRNRAKRRYVNRQERSGPTRETLAKLPIDPFPLWEKLGERDGGLEPQQTTALLEIVDAFNSVTGKLGYKPMVFERRVPGALRDMTPAETRAWETWFSWAIHFEARTGITGFRAAQWVLKRDRKTNAGDRADPRLALAADLWRTISSDYDRGVTVSAADYHPAIDRTPPEPERTRIRTWAQPAPA